MGNTELYQVLGVDPKSSSAEIKKAYHKLSLRHHPDKNVDDANYDPSSYHRIQNAYEILSDDTKRREYDQGYIDGNGNPKASTSAGGGFNFSFGDDFDFDDIFDDPFASRFGFQDFYAHQRSHAKRATPARKRPGPAPATNITIKVKLEELYNGRVRKFNVRRSKICKGCDGNGMKGNVKRRACDACNGSGQENVTRRHGYTVINTVRTCTKCLGEGYSVRPQDLCKKCKGNRTVEDKQIIQVKIERGMLPGSKIFIVGAGDEKPEYKEPSDIVITLECEEHATFSLRMRTNRRENTMEYTKDLQTTVSITFTESLLGFERMVTSHLDGRAIVVRQPPPGQPGHRVLQTGDELTVLGEGMPARSSSSAKGDLVLKIVVEPVEAAWVRSLSPQQIQTLETLLPPGREDMSKTYDEDKITRVEDCSVFRPTRG